MHAYPQNYFFMGLSFVERYPRSSSTVTDHAACLVSAPASYLCRLSLLGTSLSNPYTRFCFMFLAIPFPAISFRFCGARSSHTEARFRELISSVLRRNHSTPAKFASSGSKYFLTRSLVLSGFVFVHLLIDCSSSHSST